MQQPAPDGPTAPHADAEWLERPTNHHLSAWLDRTTHSRHVAAGFVWMLPQEARRSSSHVLWEMRLRRNGDVDVTIALPATRCALAAVARVPGALWGETARSVDWWSGVHLVHARWPSTVACDLERCAARAEDWALQAAAGIGEGKGAADVG